MESRVNDLIANLSSGRLGRREFLTRMAVIPGGIAAAAAVLPMLPAETARAQFGPPPFTPAEGERRHARIRAMMAEQGLDCMIVPHRAGDGVNLLQYAGYVSGGGFFPYGDGAVVFPLEGDPIIVANRLPSPWISRAKPVVFEDGVQVPLGRQIVEAVEELGLANSTIGVVGTITGGEGVNEFMNDGLVTYATWATVLAGLPNAEFTDISGEFAVLMMVKGEEEIAACTQAALIGESLHEMLLETTQVGTDPAQLRENVALHLLRNGATADVQAAFLPPGPMGDGTVFNSEYGIIHGGGYCQVTLCMVVGTMSLRMEALAEVAHELMDYGAEHLRAGKRFGDLMEEMEQINRRTGYWHRVPHIHGLLPMTLVGPVFPGENAPGSRTLGAGVVVQEGMIFSFEPGAREGPMAEAKVGATAIVTADGLNVINTIGTRVQQV